MMDKTIQQYIQNDKAYFKKIILEYEELRKQKKLKPNIEKSKHIAKHPNGQINVAIYDPQTDIMKQYNCVSKDRPKGTSRMLYKVHQNE